MPNTLTLHCGIPNCQIHYAYPYSDDIIAINAYWHKEANTNELLAESPIVGGRYVLELNFPVQLDLSLPFWALFMEPLSARNGLDTETGIQSMLFCSCKTNGILSQNEKQAKLEVEITELNSLTSLHNIPATQQPRLPDIEKDIAAGYGSIDHFENFSLVRVDFQGDCGTQSIIWKNNGQCYLVAENDWDFHRDTWQRLNEPLSREQELSLGIVH